MIITVSYRISSLDYLFFLTSYRTWNSMEVMFLGTNFCFSDPLHPPGQGFGILACMTQRKPSVLIRLRMAYRGVVLERLWTVTLSDQESTLRELFLNRHLKSMPYKSLCQTCTFKPALSMNLIKTRPTHVSPIDGNDPGPPSSFFSWSFNDYCVIPDPFGFVSDDEIWLL